MTMPTWSWIPITLFAVLMQTARTAGQKHLSAELDAVTVTLARFLFGLPFALLFLVAVAGAIGGGTPLPPLNATFIVFATLAALAQILATVLLIRLFSLRNFAVGTAYVRSEAVLTALLGVLLFGERIPLWAWLGIIISVAGVMLLTAARGKLDTSSSLFWNRAAALGLGSGLCFAVASLSLRTASLSFELDRPLLTAGITLVYMVALQTLLMSAHALWREPRRVAFAALLRRWRLALFVGLTSALGSIGWFVAMTIEQASYVKSLGQIEFVFALALSSWLFRERSSAAELIAMLLIAGGIVLLISAA